MIVSTRRNFIFVHIPKTAGSSIRHALTVLKVPTSDERMADINAASKNTYHETYQQFIDHYTQRTGNSVTTAYGLRPVAFIRNPYTRFLSMHRFLIELHSHRYPDIPEDINEFARQFDQGRADWVQKIRGLIPQSHFLQGIEKAEQPAFIGRFETIADDIEKLSDWIGESLHVPHKKKSSAGSVDYKDIYTKKTMAILQKHYESDFKGFDYPL